MTLSLRPAKPGIRSLAQRIAQCICVPTPSLHQAPLRQR